MKTMKLTVGERLIVIGVLQKKTGTLETLNLALKTVDKMSLNEEEQKVVGFKQVPGIGDASASFKWSKPDWTAKVELSDDQYKIFKEAFGEKDQKAEWSMQEVIPATGIQGKIEKLDAKEKKAE